VIEAGVSPLLSTTRAAASPSARTQAMVGRRRPRCGTRHAAGPRARAASGRPPAGTRGCPRSRRRCWVPGRRSRSSWDRFRSSVGWASRRATMSMTGVACRANRRPRAAHDLSTGSGAPPAACAAPVRSSRG
jgi:hypothetical protein